MSLRSLPIPMALCAALWLSCKAPVTPPPPDPPARAGLRTGSRLDERPEKQDHEHGAALSDSTQRSGAAFPSRPEGAGVDREGRDGPHVRNFQRCFSEDTSSSQQRPLGALLDRAADLYDQASQQGGARRPASPPPAVQTLYEKSLACAEEAARVEPRSVEAHHGRALALQELGRLESARDAITRALALDPDDPETLASAADLYVNRLPPGLDHTETGLEYARRGSRRARRTHDKTLIARLALLEGQALNDLGHAREALSRLDASLAAEDDVRVRYERAVALFDLCRFEDARKGFEEVVARVADDAWGHHHLGLVLEVLGKPDEAERLFARARDLAPRDFPQPLLVPPDEFRQIVAKEVAALPAALREDLSRATLETADLPDVADLTAEEPPLSPTILGLFRGAPLPTGEVTGRESTDPRTIVLYRKNLLRAVTTRDELVTQVRTTLLHELGHLRGEDDEVLRARGLE